MGDRGSVEYWERRLFRNTYTARGVRREVTGWCVKIQWSGIRRTIRLAAQDRRVAAKEAMAVYDGLLRDGWAEPGGPGRTRRSGATATGDQVPRLLGIGPRKYVSEFRAGRTREYFAEVAYDGRIERVALATESENEAKIRALDLRAELGAGGWDRIQSTYSLEVTVAVFWYANPMTCTYTTLLGIPASEAGGNPKASGGRTGWRVLVVEPDGPIRRALVHGLSAAPEVAWIEGVATLTTASVRGRWDVILGNRAVAFPASRRGGGGEDGPSPVPRRLTHALFADSDAIFASVSGVSRGYFLKRLSPSRLLEPLVSGLPEGPGRSRVDEDRRIRRYIQSTFEPEEGTADPAAPQFSFRETQVLDLLGRGYADKEIANDLGISVWTVHSHLKRIFAKYGVRTRTEAVVKHLQK